MSVKVPPRSIQNSQADSEGVSDKRKRSLSSRRAEHRESRAALQATNRFAPAGRNKS